jgi:hypothetical protein
MQYVRQEWIVLEFRGFDGVVVLGLHAVRMGLGYSETESRCAGYLQLHVQ